MKKKVCIVSGGLLPVPAVCGGAVETLAACIAEENAKQNGDDDHKRDGDEVKRAERLGFLHLSL